jgi:hypothetical protein
LVFLAAIFQVKTRVDLEGDELEEFYHQQAEKERIAREETTAALMKTYRNHQVRPGSIH